MLVKFCVKNFRGFRDNQVLSLVSSKEKTMQDTNTQATGMIAVPNLFRSAIIYGENGSGKSNLIKELHHMRSVVTDSAIAIQPFQKLAAQPFRFDDHSSVQPSKFEVTLLLDVDAAVVGGIEDEFAFGHFCVPP